jgi:hypothetical protein
LKQLIAQSPLQPHKSRCRVPPISTFTIVCHGFSFTQGVFLHLDFTQ